ncbi:MAG: ABC transporter ATP-binding protein [Synechococcaceae cyanobacterium SM2_3_2]|nr:ABC transporter ATP-binding protein [Synechococcaceae cyanobacterium SM2_3_2]
MLDVSGLQIAFTLYEQGLKQKRVMPIRSLDLEIKAGEVVAVVGSSGSGKSLLAHAILGILPHNAEVLGEIRFQGERLTPQRQAQIRGQQIALIPQSVGYLDPLMPVGSQVQLAARRGSSPSADVEGIFRRYQLASTVRQYYPFQLSGGMARRVLVSTAAIGSAQLVIADEPTPGLHPHVVTETLTHLRQLADGGRAVMLITHDIEAALQIADWIAVFYGGTTVEMARREDFRLAGNSGQSMPTGLRHPYTRALWAALPHNGFQSLPGSQPNSEERIAGCLFASRCGSVTEQCQGSLPPRQTVAEGWVRCFHAQG